MPFNEPWYRLGRALVGLLSRGAFELSVHWKACLPEGPVILAANHPTTIDPAMVTTLTRRRLSILIRESLFKVPLFGRSLRACGHICVVRGSGGQPLEQARALLRSGQSVVIFPEGEISPADGSFNPARSGLARLALSTGVPVVPVGIHVDHSQVRLVKSTIDGIEETGAWYFNGPYAMTIGAAVRFEGDAEDRSLVHAVTAQVMDHIRMLAGESARRTRARRRMGWLGAPGWYIISPLRLLRTLSIFGGLRISY